MASPQTENRFDMTGRVAIVTGSTRGIGRAIAEALAAAGAVVVISSRKADKCTEVAKEIRAEGGEADAIVAHVGRKPELEALVAETVARHGRLDVLVCNAATNPAYGPLADLTDDMFETIMTTNVLGTLWLANHAMPHLVAARGSVVIISSIAALRGTVSIGAYGMSKAAEVALTRNLALEWGPQGVRVNAIAPGLVRTDFSRVLLEDPERKRRAEQRTPLRRVGDPTDIAGIAHFLASDAAAYVTGQVIVADGGETIS